MATRITRHPTALVLATGVLAGSMYVLARAVAASGVHPAWMLAAQGLVAGGALTALATATGGMPVAPRHLRFYLLAGLTGITLPNFVGFLALREISAGLYSLIVTLTPLATWLLSSAMNGKLDQPFRLLGVLLGLAGVAGVIVPSIGSDGAYLDDVSAISLLLGLAVPALIAVGNVYRARNLPRDAGVLAMAGGTLLSQVPLSAGVAISIGAPAPSGGSLPMVALLGLATLAMYLPYFRLQAVADAVQFSQIGYVIALTGIAGGAIALGESLPAALLAGVPLVFLGLAMTNGHLDPKSFLKSTPWRNTP